MGEYRARRQLPEKATPITPTNQTTKARYSRFITSIATNDTTYIPQPVINEYDPLPGEHEPVRPRPPSPLISKVSKGLQSMTHKIHEVAKKTTPKGSAPSSSASSTSLQPTKSNPSKKSKQAQKTPNEVFLDDDKNSWPFGMRFVGRDGGENGKWCYRDQMVSDMNPRRELSMVG